MPFYQVRGTIPQKRHTILPKENGKIHYEELVSRNGFSSLYSNLYHIYPPTRVGAVLDFKPYTPEKLAYPHCHRHLRTSAITQQGTDFITSRVPLLFNHDVILSCGTIHQTSQQLFRNGHHDELWFIHHGNGTLKTNYGNLHYKQWDYIVIPRGTIYYFDVAEETKYLLIENRSMISIPGNYKNESGQLEEHAPYCERDIQTPLWTNPLDDNTPHSVLVKLENGFQEYIYQNHPFDVVGWDGFNYPWIFNIQDFCPIVGKVHQPPPVHQTFQLTNAVICSFTPRLFDFHEKAIPSPYAHSNVDSDEVLYYVDGNFMSRKGVEPGSITHHPMGLPHGPQPGKTEASIGKKETYEYAVMLDTFNPLYLTQKALKIEDPDYKHSWRIS